MFLTVTAILLGLLIVSVLTIAVLIDKVNKLKKENELLERKAMSIKIKKIINDGEYNVVKVNLLGENYSGFRAELAELKVEANEISEEITEGKLLELKH